MLKALRRFSMNVLIPILALIVLGLPKWQREPMWLQTSVFVLFCAATIMVLMVAVASAIAFILDYIRRKLQ